MTANSQQFFDFFGKYFLGVPFQNQVDQWGSFGRLLDGHNDLALLLVGFHVLVGLDYFLQRKGAINDRFQCAGLEAVVDIRLAAGQLLRFLYDFEQSITS